MNGENPRNLSFQKITLLDVNSPLPTVWVFVPLHSAWLSKHITYSKSCSLAQFKSLTGTISPVGVLYQTMVYVNCQPLPEPYTERS